MVVNMISPRNVTNYKKTIDVLCDTASAIGANKRANEQASKQASLSQRALLIRFVIRCENS